MEAATASRVAVSSGHSQTMEFSWGISRVGGKRDPERAADVGNRRLRRSMRDLAEAVIQAGDLNRKDGGNGIKVAVREDEKIM